MLGGILFQKNKCNTPFCTAGGSFDSSVPFGLSEVSFLEQFPEADGGMCAPRPRTGSDVDLERSMGSTLSRLDD